MIEENNTGIALLPVSSFACRTAKEAATAVDYLKVSSNLKYVIPMHYGYNGYTGNIGSFQDAITLGLYVKSSVVILDSMATT